MPMVCVDDIVGAVTGSLARPAAVIAGRYSDEGQTGHCGRSSQLKGSQSEALAEIVVHALDDSWPTRLSPAGRALGLRPDLTLSDSNRFHQLG